MSATAEDPRIAFVPALDNALELAETAILAQQEGETKLAARDQLIAQLQQQLADKDKVILEKVASAPILDPVKLERLFDRFEGLHIMSPGERVKMAAHVQRDPNLLFPLFLKAAEMLAGAPAEGSGVPSDEAFWTSPAKSNRDADGWDEAVEGKVVQLK